LFSSPRVAGSSTSAAFARDASGSPINSPCSQHDGGGSKESILAHDVFGRRLFEQAAVLDRSHPTVQRAVIAFGV